MYKISIDLEYSERNAYIISALTFSTYKEDFMCEINFDLEYLQRGMHV